MYNEVMTGVKAKVESLFPEAAVGFDHWGQDTEKPVFKISLMETWEKPVSKYRYLRSISLCIQYLQPEGMQSATDTNQVLEVLMDELEQISIGAGKQIRGVNKKGRVENGALSFMTEYQLFLLRGKEAYEPMEDIEVKERSAL